MRFVPLAIGMATEKSNAIGLGRLFLEGIADGELVGCPALVGFAGLENRVWKLRLVGAVGKVLRFKTQSALPRIGTAGFSGQGTIEEVCGVELKPPLIGKDSHHPAAGFLVEDRGWHRVGFLGIEDKGVVIPAAIGQLLIGLVDIPSDRLGLTKIERGIGHWHNFAGGNRGLVDREHRVGMDLEFVQQHSRRAFTCQIEIAVIR